MNVLPLNQKSKIESFLYTIFLTVFFLLLIVQGAMLNPSIRAGAIMNNEAEGVLMGVEEYLFNKGSLEIQLLNIESSPLLKVLVNGEEGAAFDGKSVKIEVIDGDVIELDGSEVVERIGVIITSASANLSNDCLGTILQIDSKVQKLVKVKVNTK